MTVKIFAIDAADTWLHAYEVNGAVAAMPVGGELYGVDGVRYTVTGTTLTPTGTALTTAALDARLLTALTTIEASLKTRLDHQAITEAKRAERLAQATALVTAVRAGSDPAGRFTVMKPAFAHAPGGFSPGSWLHNLFCH